MSGSSGHQLRILIVDLAGTRAVASLARARVHWQVRGVRGRRHHWLQSCEAQGLGLSRAVVRRCTMGAARDRRIA